MNISPDEIIRRIQEKQEHQRIERLNWPELVAFLLEATDLDNYGDAVTLLEALDLWQLEYDWIGRGYHVTDEGDILYRHRAPHVSGHMVISLIQDAGCGGSAKVLLERYYNSLMWPSHAAEFVASTYGWPLEKTKLVIEPLLTAQWKSPDLPSYTMLFCWKLHDTTGHYDDSLWIDDLRLRLLAEGLPEPFPQWWPPAHEVINAPASTPMPEGASDERFTDATQSQKPVSFPGRPSVISQVEKEMRRRAKDGEMFAKLSHESEYLAR